VLLSLPEQPLATGPGAIAGILTGVGTIAYTSLTGTTFAKLFPTLPSVITDLNIGIVAMALNVVVVLVVSALTRVREVKAERLPA